MEKTWPNDIPEEYRKQACYDTYWYTLSLLERGNIETNSQWIVDEINTLKGCDNISNLKELREKLNKNNRPVVDRIGHHYVWIKNSLLGSLPFYTRIYYHTIHKFKTSN